MKHEVEDRVELFFQRVPVSDLFSSVQLGDQKKEFRELLCNCGFNIKRSDLKILDHSRIGNYTIMIARYTLDYQDDGDQAGRLVTVDGSVAMKIDDSGRRDIRVSLKTDPFGPGMDTSRSELPQIGGKILPD